MIIIITISFISVLLLSSLPFLYVCVYYTFTICALHVSEMVKVLIYTDIVVAFR